MVENLDPLGLGEGIREQRREQGPGVQLGTPAHISKELCDARLFDA